MKRPPGWRSGTAGALAAALLVGGCGPGAAPGCDAPETVERLLVHTFTAMYRLGSVAGQPAPALDWEARTIVAGPDTAYFQPRGDSLLVADRRGGARAKVLAAYGTRIIYEDARTGTWECEAAVNAGSGMAIPVRYTSTRNRDGEHVVRGSLKGTGGEVAF